MHVSSELEKTASLGRRRNVVIIGGGVAGSLVAKSLQFGSNVTLVDAKEYFEIPWGSLRAMVEPSFAERSVINHRDYLTNGILVTSPATNITKNELLTEEGRKIPYDYLVIATGHADLVPKSRTNRLRQYQEEYLKIISAQSILIIGGGPTGVELAGEIAVDFPKKKVILVHSGSRLLEFLGQKASEKTMKWLASKNVEVKLGERIHLDSVSVGNNEYQTSTGETIKADCHFLCTGKPIGSAWLKETILKNDLDKEGRIKVDEFLRVKGRLNIFAVGDIAAVQEMKQGYLAQKQARVAVNNINLLMDGRNESELETYASHSGMAIVSLGRKDAVAQFPFATVVGRIPGLLKSGDVFVGKTRKEMGLPST